MKSKTVLTLSVAKSSNWMRSSGKTTDISYMNSSMNSFISVSEMRG